LLGHVLVIAEKPKAAEKIAHALGKPRKLKKYGVPYWEIVNGKRIVVAPAAGHLFGLTTSSPGFPVYTYEWKPLYEVDKGASHTKKFLALLASVSKGASLYVNACDYDVEGSVIGFMIIKHFGDLKRSKRMIFHALTPQELRRAWRSLRPLDWEMVEAGLARHELDWLWGINVSRALMRAYKKATGKRKVLSAGRVQSPTLNKAVERELEIKTFVPIPHFTVSVKAKNVSFEPTLKFERRKDAEAWKRGCAKGKVVDVVRRVEELSPPHPFNLPDLQAEAARIYGYSPAKTQSIAEDLYLDALISYPRTNSQKYPKDLDIAGILSSLSKGSYASLVKALFKETKGHFKPNNGPKDDPAHPAIYPTGKVPTRLDRDHQRIYDLIVRRFMATMASKARYEVVTVVLEINGERFKAVGRKRRWMGWSLYYPFSAPQEKDLPPFSKGEEIIPKCSLRMQYSKPPERFTKASLVKWMEKVGIGTEATRARIAETLFNRGYLKSVKGKVYATELGIAVASVLSKHFKDLTDVNLTRKFEQEMEMIRQGKKRREEVVEDAKRVLRTLLTSYMPKLPEAGAELAYALGEMEPEQRCPLCNRPRKGEYCELHEVARRRLEEAYVEWKRRLGLSWEEYLEKISKLKDAGEMVKDVASRASSAS